MTLYDIPAETIEGETVTLARYRGSACGARYAEAVWAMQTRSTQIF